MLTKISERNHTKLAKVTESARRRLKMLASSIASRPYSTLDSVPKTSSFTEKLDNDPELPSPEFVKDPHTPQELFRKARRLRGGAFSWCPPEIRKEYQFLLASENALKDLNLDPANEPLDEKFRKIVSGEAAQDEKYPFPYAQCYAGYQFGQFAGQLGDGRVVNLFEVTNPETNKRYELQLKGAGKTPFSRFADGKAVLRSSIREFIISESLNGVGIPTTRALAITSLPQTYAQRYGAEQCAIVCRMAESWVRIGSFDIYRHRGDRKGAIKLADYTIDEVLSRYSVQLPENFATSEQTIEKLGELTKYDKMYFHICYLNARTAAYWHAYAFLNGVLNTDNTSILGLSIDFGPFAYMDTFDPDYTSNHDDHELRYSFRNTPSAIWWNLTRLGEDIAELIGAGPELVKDEHFFKVGLKEEWKQPLLQRAETVIDAAANLYENTFIEEFLILMDKRLGISEHQEDDHQILISPMFDMLQNTKLDFNNFFLTLQSLKLDDEKFDYDIAAEKFIPENFTEDPFTKYTRKYVLDEIKSWLALYKNRLEEGEISDEQRHEVASKVNPLFVPRNWILDSVIEYTQDNKGDTRYLSKLLKMSSNPYDPEKWGAEDKELEEKWLGPVDLEKQMTQCSCSS